jgi:hypothetical protein
LAKFALGRHDPNWLWSLPEVTGKMAMLIALLFK